MILLESIFIALTQLWTNKLRSFLTLLGMLIGVGSVVGIVSISEGLRSYIADEFGKLGGANLIFVSPQSVVLKDGRWVRAKHYEPMTLADIDLVQEASERVDVVLPILGMGTQVRFRKATFQSQVTATIPPYTRAFDWEIEEGRFLLDRDLQQRRTVCVLGMEVKKEVFGDLSPLGREVKLNNHRYTVVGVLKERRLFGFSQGNQVMVPVTTAQKRLFGNKYINGLFVYTKQPEDAPQVIPLIEKTLKKEHGKRSEYRIVSTKGILDDVEKITMIMKMVTGGIAGISLLVGGIGIMNIMLVSVTERTREIGIRKALGAKPATLLMQFIIEAIVLSLVGGLLGVGLGTGLGMGISAVIEHYAEVPYYPSVVSLPSVLLSLGISVAIGLFFGIYPAARAARLNPVDALSFE
ncbi:MAG: FtsX-like permease family protein [Gemmatimonadetes bacterium]|jgi:putative ABC transport system permease protein|nr:FtsX-like permease family protein [Gemmatimonadota bacterium]